MMGIDTTKDFIPVRIAVLTVSDTRGLAEDRSGDVLVERLEAAGHRLADRAILRDEQAAIEAKLRAWIADPAVDAVISTGGTGLTGRDVTVEAHEAVYEKAMPAFGTLFTMLSFQKIGTSAIQSRACAGVAGAPTSSPCRARRAPAATPGTASSARSSTTATGPATSSRSCRASRSTAAASRDTGSGRLARKAASRARGWVRLRKGRGRGVTARSSRSRYHPGARQPSMSTVRALSISVTRSAPRSSTGRGRRET
jgi:molybdopterin adenylyltransferase